MLRLFLSALLVLFAALPAFAQGLRAQSAHFDLRSDAPVDARAVLSDLEAFRLAVLADLGLDPDDTEERLRLNIVDDTATFDAVTPGGITAAIYRQSAAGHDVIIGYSAEPGHFLSRALEPEWLRLVLRHEVVHHILETRYPRKLPIWLGEGLAEHYATYERDADGRAVFGRTLPEQEPLSASQHWLPMGTVIENLARYPDFRLAQSRLGSTAPDAAQRLYYGQSLALAQFVIAQPDGLASVHRFVDGLEPGGSGEDSFEAAFGLRYDPLESRIRERLSDADAATDRPVRTSTSGSTVTVRDASPDERLENHLRLLLSHGRIATATQSRIDAVRAALGPAEATVTMDLARAVRSWRLGDWNGSDRATARVLAADPDNARALKIRAKSAYGRVSERQSEEALWDAAEAAALAALAVRPDDAELHLFRVAVSLPTTTRLDAGARESLDWLQGRAVHQTLPHTAMMMIPALIYERRFDQADRVLDSAARWTEQSGDRWVIDRLRRNVASERARVAATDP